MLKSPLLFAIAALVTLLSWSGIAQANEDNLALDFTLPSNSQQPIPNQAIPDSAPRHLAKTVALAPSQASIQTLARYSDPLPPLKPEATVQVERSKPSDLALSFDSNNLKTLPVEAEAPVEAAPKVQESEAQNSEKSAYQNLRLDDQIFEGGSNSLVAHTVGSAEGTRSSNGQRTQAYYGHRDPGNGVWNIGTFSYQHGAQTPEEADAKQLERLKYQGLQLEEQAKSQGIELSLEAKLNGIDLANQAPLAALDRGGYIEQLAKAYRLNMTGSEAIVWARTHAYLDPDTQRWNAPGLGNNVDSIDRDQRRRADAIALARTAFDDPRFNELNLDRLSHITLAANNPPKATPNQSPSSPALAFESGDQTSDQITDLAAVTPSENLLQPSELSFGLPPSNPSREEVKATSHEANLAILPVPPLPIPVSSSTVLTAKAPPVAGLEAKKLENQPAIAANLPIPAPLAEPASAEPERPEPDPTKTEVTETEPTETEVTGTEPGGTEVIASNLNTVQSPQPHPEHQRLWHFEDKVGRQLK